MSDNRDIRSTTGFKMAWAKIIARANYDQSFCHKLQHNPVQVLRSYGVDVPDDIDLNEKVHPKLSKALAVMQHSTAPGYSGNCATDAPSSPAIHHHVHLMAPFSQPHAMQTWGICACAMSPSANQHHTAGPAPMYTQFGATMGSPAQFTGFGFCPTAAPHPMQAAAAAPPPTYTQFGYTYGGAAPYTGFGACAPATQPHPAAAHGTAATQSAAPSAPEGHVHALYTFFCGSAA